MGSTNKAGQVQKAPPTEVLIRDVDKNKKVTSPDTIIIAQGVDRASFSMDEFIGLVPGARVIMGKDVEAAQRGIQKGVGSLFKEGHPFLDAWLKKVASRGGEKTEKPADEIEAPERFAKKEKEKFRPLVVSVQIGDVVKLVTVPVDDSRLMEPTNVDNLRAHCRAGYVLSVRGKKVQADLPRIEQGMAEDRTKAVEILTERSVKLLEKLEQKK